MKNKKVSLNAFSHFSSTPGKKGISAVVATVLIILITVAAVTIIWAAIIPMINDQLDRGTVCLDAVQQVSIDNSRFTCFDADNNQTRVQVSYGAQDIGLLGIQFIVYDNAGSTTSFTVNDTSLLPTVNGEKVVVINTTTINAASVAIAPIVVIGDGQGPCKALNPVELTAC